MTTKHETWNEFQIENFRAHPEQVPIYLNFSFLEAEQSGQWGAFMAGLRTVAEAQGGLGALAEKLGCSRTTLYRTLSKTGNPRLETLGAILRVFGLQLAVQPLAKSPVKKRAKAESSKRKSAVAAGKRRGVRAPNDSPVPATSRVARG